MVKKALVALVVLVGLAAPPSAMAGCTTGLLDCFGRAAKVDNFWYRTAAGVDCELEYIGCAGRTVRSH